MILAFLALGAAPETRPEDLVEAVQAKYRRVDTLQARVTEISHSDLFGDERSSGTFVIQRPDKMRWTYDGTGKEIVADGQHVWVYTPQNHQALKYAAGPQADVITPQLLLRALDHLPGEFEVVLVSTDRNGSVLDVIPHVQDPPFVNLRVEVDPNLVLRHLTITGKSGVTEVEMTDVVLGAPIPDETFRFEVPPGVDVVET